MQNSRVITLDEFIALTRDITDNWLLKLSALASNPIVFCGFTQGSWDVILEDLSDPRITRAWERYKSGRYYISGTTIVIEPDFLDWCCKQPCYFLIGDDPSTTTMRYNGITWKKLTSNKIFFSSASKASVLFSDCDFTDMDNYTIFLHDTPKHVSCTNCELDQGLFDSDLSRNYSLRWCTGYDKIQYFDCSHLEIFFKTLSEFPMSFKSLNTIMTSFVFKGMLPNGDRSPIQVPRDLINSLSTVLKKCRYLNISVNVPSGEMRPLQLFNIDMTQTHMRVISPDIGVNSAYLIVVAALNPSSGDKTSRLLDCQEQLIEMGLGRYAKF